MAGVRVAWPLLLRAPSRPEPPGAPRRAPSSGSTEEGRCACQPRERSESISPAQSAPKQTEHSVRPRTLAAASTPAQSMAPPGRGTPHDSASAARPEHTVPPAAGRVLPPEVVVVSCGTTKMAQALGAPRCLLPARRLRGRRRRCNRSPRRDRRAHHARHRARSPVRRCKATAMGGKGGWGGVKGEGGRIVLSAPACLSESSTGARSTRAASRGWRGVARGPKCGAPPGLATRPAAAPGR